MLMPFSQLLQTPINLARLEGRFEAFEGWNERIETQVWPELINWVLSVGEIAEKPKYHQPKEPDALRSIGIVLSALSAHYPAFKVQYEALENDASAVHPISWNFAAFFTGFFQEGVG